MTLRPLLGLFAFSLFFTACDQANSSHAKELNKSPLAISLAEKSFKQHRDFSLSYWADKITADKPKFVIESNYFHSEISTKTLSIATLEWRDGSVDRHSRQAKTNQVSAIPFSINQIINGKSHKLLGFQDNKRLENCALIENGRFFQRRVLSQLLWQDLKNQEENYYEISAWPDHVQFHLDLPQAQAINWEIDLQAYADVKIINNTNLSFSTSKGKKFRLSTNAQKLKRVGKKIFFEFHSSKASIRFIPNSSQNNDSLSKEITITAQQTLPKANVVPVKFNENLQAFQFDLDHINTKHLPEEQNKRQELIKFQVSNKSAQAKQVKLVFSKKGSVGPITGISSILRDADGTPNGTHIQLSKNWHKGSKHKFEGAWFRGFTLLTVPAKSTLDLQYLSVNGFFGNLPAASHNQLALPGYQSKRYHLWEQSALGAWGESICYDPNHGLASAITDVRPLMVRSMSPMNKKWSWTNNVGGGEFFSVYKNGKATPLKHIKVKVDHKRNCPVLTEVTYASELEDGSAELSYTASLSRTDDMVRGIYNIDYIIKKDISFDRLVLFQVGADNYNYTHENEFAVGHGKTMTKTWATAPGGNQYKSPALKLDKANSWVSLHKSDPMKEGASANRGIIIRSWKASIHGSTQAPWAIERSLDLGRRKTSICDIILDPKIKILKAGDRITACIEMIVTPQFANDYYGPNEKLHQALKINQNTWKMIARDAAENDLQAKIIKGSIIRQRPLKIAVDQKQAEFTLKGGLAYQPVTFTQLGEYKKALLEIKTASGWKKVPQSEFLQNDYNPKTKRWEITYSLDLNDPAPKHFRFSLP
ncbi:hypothetical protein PQO03_17310 [Lentisphaera profundi]|uniref:Uncharacterized protein n=1 Tax=Lentisphaera profundi TaxID=1658616 RepID=A0ABY7VZZ7_9BACT|nr:hypothetical protein [Lentisphaera profundi]WDE97588.1 hypothetical protein PQO03_17310 [Lentisphaera profundi]